MPIAEVCILPDIAKPVRVPNEVVADVEDITTAIRGEPQDGRVKDPRGDM